jgi:prefoldin subunit 5
MEREIEFLRQQIEYLDRMLETCTARISSLEAQVAELQRRPVAIVSPKEREKKSHEVFGPAEEGLVRVGEATFGEATFWEIRSRRKG